MKTFILASLLSFNVMAQSALMNSTTPAFSQLESDAKTIKCKVALNDPVLATAGGHLKRLLRVACRLLQGKDE
jgi:hypothetical protein